MKLIILVCTMMVVGCSSSESAQAAFNAFRMNCNRNSFTVNQKTDGDKVIFTVTCTKEN